MNDARRSPGLAGAVLFCCIVFLIPAALRADTAPARFFLMGDGRIHIKHARTGVEASVSLLRPDGTLDEKALSAIDRVFGFPGNEKGEHISPRLIFMLDYFSDLVAPGKVINLESGYRSPDYNSNLRNKGGNVAKTSIHMDAMACDFSIQGVNGKELWKIIKEKNCCGIGNYGGATVHLDAAKPRFWEAATSKVRTGESDFNRRIYLTTDYDRYMPGEKVRLSFVSVSDFGFGIQPVVAVVTDAEGEHTTATARILTGETDCMVIANREASHFISFNLPPDLRAGRYRIRVDYCRRPYDQMPLKTISNEIELVKPSS